MNRRRMIAAAVAALGLAAMAGLVGWKGLQTCGWLDRASGRSGCLGTVSFDGVGLSRSSVAQPLGDERVVMAVDMRTADGWRPGLIVFDPVTGAESRRYPLPLWGGNPRLFLSPGGTRLLIVCGVIEKFCTESGSEAVVTDRDDLRSFEAVAIDDYYLTAYPGTPMPPEEHGYRAFYVAQESRILAGGSMEPLVLLDAGGTLIAQLDRPGMSAYPAAVSATGIIAREASGTSAAGGRVRFWDVRDGAELGRIEGRGGWQLRAAPFWSEDGTMLFIPRERNGVMLLDRFRAPSLPETRS